MHILSGDKVGQGRQGGRHYPTMVMDICMHDGKMGEGVTSG